MDFYSYKLVLANRRKFHRELLYISWHKPSSIVCANLARTILVQFMRLKKEYRGLVDFVNLCSCWFINNEYYSIISFIHRSDEFPMVASILEDSVRSVAPDTQQTYLKISLWRCLPSDHVFTHHDSWNDICEDSGCKDLVQDFLSGENCRWHFLNLHGSVAQKGALISASTANSE